MRWVTFIWAVVIGACATMALPHLLIGIKRRTWENLFFAIAALSVASIACGELAIMHSRTAEQIGRAIQWTHLPVFFLVLAIVGFVRFYFGTGRLWLGIAACVARLVCLVINFAVPPNLSFREITSLRQFSFLGETIAMPEGVVSPWTHLGELSSLLVVAFVVDAWLTLWRRGTSEDRRRAVVVGGSITLFILVAAGLSALVHAKVIDLPYLVSFPFLGVIAAMGYELSRDVLRAARLARELGEEERRLDLAAQAGGLGMWRWDVANDQGWMNEKGRSLFGFFFFQAEDGIRDLTVTGVQTCALPIWVTVVAPSVLDSIRRPGVQVEEREFVPADLEGKWFAVAAAPPEVNRAVARAAEERAVFVNAVDDTDSASAYLGGVFRKGGVTVAVSTDGRAPALAGLLREALQALLPDELESWAEVAQQLRAHWKADGVAIARRRPLLLRAINELYREAA